jgi:hypothetical protein
MDMRSECTDNYVLYLLQSLSVRLIAVLLSNPADDQLF